MIAEKMESAKSEPNLEIIREFGRDNEDNSEENKENFAPDDEFDDKNIKYIFYFYPVYL